MKVIDASGCPVRPSVRRDSLRAASKRPRQELRRRPKKLRDSPGTWLLVSLGILAELIRRCSNSQLHDELLSKEAWQRDAPGLRDRDATEPWSGRTLSAVSRRTDAAAKDQGGASEFRCSEQQLRRHADRAMLSDKQKNGLNAGPKNCQWTVSARG